MPCLQVDSDHKETGQDNQGRGGRNSRDRKLECEKKVLILMDKIFQAGVNLSELGKNEGERRSEVDAKTEYVCVAEKNCNYWN